MIRTSMDALRSDTLLGFAAGAAADRIYSRIAVKVEHWRSQRAVRPQSKCGSPAVVVQFSAVCLRDALGELVLRQACGKVLRAARLHRCCDSRMHNSRGSRMFQMERYWGHWTMRTAGASSAIAPSICRIPLRQIARHLISVGLSPENLRQNQALARV